MLYRIEFWFEHSSYPEGGAWMAMYKHEGTKEEMEILLPKLDDIYSCNGLRGKYRVVLAG